jgi:hypothetical protein
MKITSKTINYTVDTIAELEALAGYDENAVVVVTDENRGGTFVYRSANVATNNGGTIFNGWCRQYDGAVNVKWFGAELTNVIFNPETALGAVATVRKLKFNNVVVNNTYSGFSNGRMTDEWEINNSTVSSASTSQRYFLFSEENPKRITINNASGIDCGFRFYGGSSHTRILINDSYFALNTSGVSAFAGTTSGTGKIISNNTVYKSFGGNTGYPYDGNPNAVVAIAFTACLQIIYLIIVVYHSLAQVLILD